MMMMMVMKKNSHPEQAKRNLARVGESRGQARMRRSKGLPPPGAAPHPGLETALPCLAPSSPASRS